MKIGLFCPQGPTSFSASISFSKICFASLFLGSAAFNFSPCSHFNLPLYPQYICSNFDLVSFLSCIIYQWLLEFVYTKLSCAANRFLLSTKYFRKDKIKYCVQTLSEEANNLYCFTNWSLLCKYSYTLKLINLCHGCVLSVRTHISQGFKFLPIHDQIDLAQ